MRLPLVLLGLVSMVDGLCFAGGFGSSIAGSYDKEHALLVVDGGFDPTSRSSFGIHRFDPKTGAYLGLVNHGLVCLGAPRTILRMSSDGGSPGRVCYIGTGFTDERTYLALFDEASPAEVTKIPLPGTPMPWGQTVIWPMGDVDGEPGDEVLVVGLNGVDETGFRSAILVSTESGAVVRRIEGDWVGPVGDIDGDGCIDYVVSIVWNHTVVSGRTARTLFKYEAKPDAEDADSVAVHRAAGDVNADGKGDIIQLLGNHKLGAGFCKIAILSGEDGSSVWGPKLIDCAERMPTSVIGIPDQDGDGAFDVAVCVGWHSGKCGSLQFLSGATGEKLSEYPTPRLKNPIDLTGRFGYSIAPVGDQDDDEVCDLAVSRSTWQGTGATSGEVYVFSSKAGLLSTMRRPKEAVSSGPDSEEGETDDD